MRGGINTYLYANTKPLIFFDIKGLSTTVLIVKDSFIFGFVTIATHSAIHVDNDGSGEQFLYDPAGSYVARNVSRGRGDFFSGSAASVEQYIAFHQSAGSAVEVIVLPTTPLQEEKIANTAIEIGGTAGGLCSVAASSALGGVFGIKASLFPSQFATDAKEALKGVQEKALRCDN